MTFAFSSRRRASRPAVDEEVRVADLFDANAAEHLAHDRLDVLVVDTDALQAINLLDLVHEPGRELLLALHPEDVVRVRRAVLQRIARSDVVARLHLHVLALRDQVLARLIVERSAVRAERREDDLALALRVLAEADDAVDLGDDRVILRLSGLEELATRGRPPVMSCTFVVSRGILPIASPG
jgi:hypothetical protein